MSPRGSVDISPGALLESRGHSILDSLTNVHSREADGARFRARYSLNSAGSSTAKSMSVRVRTTASHSKESTYATYRQLWSPRASKLPSIRWRRAAASLAPTCRVSVIRSDFGLWSTLIAGELPRQHPEFVVVEQAPLRGGIRSTAALFGEQSALARRSRWLDRVGLGYLTIGQSPDTLFGGERRFSSLATSPTRGPRTTCA